MINYMAIICEKNFFNTKYRELSINSMRKKFMVNYMVIRVKKEIDVLN